MDDLNTFKKILKKEFENARFFTGEDLPVVKSNYTGSLRLDILLQYPFFEGAIVELFGESSSGKTTVSLSVLNQAALKDNNKKLLYLDQEMRLRSSLIDTFPVLKNRLEIIQAPNGNEALRIAELWLKQFPGSIVVIDSVDALLPDNDKEIGESQVGNLPRLMSDGCRKLARACATSSSTIIFLNQIRSKIGAYGNPDTTSGGKALSFYASQRIQLMPIIANTKIQDANGTIIGHKVRFKIVKNSVTVPFVEGEFPLIYGKGIDTVDELIDLACDIGILQKDGNYILIEDKKRPPKTVKDMARADKDFFNKILKEVKMLYPETYQNVE